MTREQLFPAASLNLRRHGDHQERMGRVFLVMGCLFLIGGALMDDEVMPGAIYGAAIARYPAEWWATAVILCSLLFLTGIRINGAWRWSPALRFAGAAGQCSVLAALIVGAFHAPAGVVMLIWGGMAIWLWGAFVWWNMADLARAMGLPDADD